MSPDSLELTSSRLTLRLDLPGTGYRGARFDWTTQVRQVTLDGRWTFLTHEKEHDDRPDHQGWGLAGEFGIATPVGFEDCPEGGEFPKMGVGLLTRPDRQDYHFARPYPLRPAAFQTEPLSQGRVRLTADQPACRGYGWSLVREWALEGAEVVLTTRLTNTGTRFWQTEEYLHNFLAFDGLSVGPGWTLSRSQPWDPNRLAESVDPEGVVTWNGDQLSWTGTPTRDFFLAEGGLHGPQNWTLSHGPTGLSVTESGDFPADRFHLWGRGHVVSPEVYLRLALAPGEFRTWTRRWSFDRRPPVVLS